MLSLILSQSGGGFYFPPLHPILAHFTVALIPISFFFDALGACLKKESLLAVGWWSLLSATILTPLTIALGWVWMVSMGGVDHWAMPWHMWIGIALGAALIPLTVWRGWRYHQGRPPGWVYLLPAAVVLFALMAQGDLGGVMSLGSGIVFKNHVVESAPPPQGGEIQWKTHLEIYP